MAQHTRYVSAKKQSNFLTPATSHTAIGEVESESFQQSFDVLKRNDINYYGSAKAILSKKIAEGSFSMPLQPDHFTLMMLHGIMGTDAQGASASAARTFNELTVSSTAELPVFTFHVGRDDKAHIFDGQVIESISVSSSIGEYAMMSVNTVGRKQSSSTTTLATAVPTYLGDAAHFAKAFVDFEGTATNSNFSKLVQSIDFEIKTNRDIENSYTLGDETCVRTPPSTVRDISGTITFSKALLTSDVTNAEPFFDEIMGATQANAQAVQNPGSGTPALSVLFEVSATDYIRFDFFKLHFEMPETSVSGRDSQTMSIAFHALYDLGDANKMMAINCRSSDSAALADYDA